MLFIGAVVLAVLVVPSPWGLVLIGAAGLVEIGETLFWLRLSQRHRARVGPETLIGARGEVETACRPEGQVRVQGELWTARCDAGVEPGDAVRVVARDGLTLVVERA